MLSEQRRGVAFKQHPTCPRAVAMAAKYKRTHSAMNTKVVLPAFSISGGKIVGAGEGGGLAADPLELVKSFGIVGEVRRPRPRVDRVSFRRGACACCAPRSFRADIACARPRRSSSSTTTPQRAWTARKTTR